METAHNSHFATAAKPLCIHCTHYRDFLETPGGRDQVDMCVNPAFPPDLVRGGVIPRPCRNERCEFMPDPSDPKRPCGSEGRFFKPFAIVLHIVVDGERRYSVAEFLGEVAGDAQACAWARTARIGDRYAVGGRSCVAVDGGAA